MKKTIATITATIALAVCASAQDFHGATTMTSIKTPAAITADTYTAPLDISRYLGRASVLLTSPVASSSDQLDVSLETSSPPTMFLDERNTTLTEVVNKIKPASGQTKLAAVFANTGAKSINNVGLRLKKIGTITAGKLVTVTIEAIAAATLSTNLTGANNDLVYTARTVGVGGNAVTVAYVDPSGNNQALAVSATGTDITVSLATDAMGAITSTSAEIKAAVEADADSTALVSVAHKGTDSGAGVVIALTKTALTGGGPSGSALATDTIAIDTEITTSFDWVPATFTTLGEIGTGTYAIVATGDYDASDDNCVVWANGAVGSGGNFETYGSAWVATATKDLMCFAYGYAFAAPTDPYNAANSTYATFTQVTDAAPLIERKGLYVPPGKRYLRALFNVTGSSVSVAPALVILGNQ